MEQHSYAERRREGPDEEPGIDPHGCLDRCAAPAREEQRPLATDDGSNLGDPRLPLAAPGAALWEAVGR